MHISERLLRCRQALDVDIAGAVLRRTPSPEPAASTPARSAPAAFAAGNYDISPAAEQHPGGRQLLAGAPCSCSRHADMSTTVCTTGFVCDRARHATLISTASLTGIASVRQLAGRRRWSPSRMWRAPTAGATSRCAAARCWCLPRCGPPRSAAKVTPCHCRTPPAEAAPLTSAPFACAAA